MLRVTLQRRPVAGHRLIGMIQPDTARPGPPDKPNLYKVGCVGRITQLAESGETPPQYE